MTEVNAKQDRDPILLKLKKTICIQKVEFFFQKKYGVLHCQGLLCVQSVDNFETMDVDRSVKFLVFYSPKCHQNIP